MQNQFHEGELKVQRLAREESMAERNGNMIAVRIMGGALPFLAQQSMVVFGSRDGQGRLWASILFGSRGFMKSADGHRVDFDLSLVTVQPHDPFWRNITANPAVGMLAIDLGSRRRIRINGEISRPAENTLQLGVKEAFPNCPKYITRRMLKTVSTAAPRVSDTNSGSVLGPEQQELLRRADLLFIATAHPTRGADASHRGGNPGFIEVLDGKTLRIPDFAGNSMFNTLGNLVVDPAAGLIVPDFEHGRALQLTGRADVLFNGDAPAGPAASTNRFVEITVARCQELPLPSNLRTELLDYSPFNPRS